MEIITPLTQNYDTNMKDCYATPQNRPYTANMFVQPPLQCKLIAHGPPCNKKPTIKPSVTHLFMLRMVQSLSDCVTTVILPCSIHKTQEWSKLQCMRVGTSTKFSGGGEQIFVGLLPPFFFFKSKAAVLHLHHTCLTEGSTYLKVLYVIRSWH